MFGSTITPFERLEMETLRVQWEAAFMAYEDAHRAYVGSDDGYVEGRGDGEGLAGLERARMDAWDAYDALRTQLSGRDKARRRAICAAATAAQASA